jgi:hypothetical protein
VFVKKIPCYSFIKDIIPTCCNDYKEKGIVNIKHKKCVCKKIPCYGFINDKRATCCKDCKNEGIINIKNKKCKTNMCGVQIFNKKYRGYCSRCFYYTFPNEPITRNYKTKEIMVFDYVKITFKNYDWISDKKIQNECSRRRPDIMCNFRNYVLIIEINENRHMGYIY